MKHVYLIKLFNEQNEMFVLCYGSKKRAEHRLKSNYAIGMPCIEGGTITNSYITKRILL